MKKGFTLVELVIVIVILGILATIALPKFVDLATEAKLKSEDAVIGALTEAIHTKHLENVSKGNNVWPCVSSSEDPFSLFAAAPPNKWFDGTADGTRWSFQQAASSNMWNIFCPHNAGNFVQKGRWYRYQYADTGIPGHQAGEVWLHINFGH